LRIDWVGLLYQGVVVLFELTQCFQFFGFLFVPLENVAFLAFIVPVFIFFRRIPKNATCFGFIRIDRIVADICPENLIGIFVVFQLEIQILDYLVGGLCLLLVALHFEIHLILHLLEILDGSDVVVSAGSVTEESLQLYVLQLQSFVFLSMFFFKLLKISTELIGILYFFFIGCLEFSPTVGCDSFHSRQQLPFHKLKLFSFIF